MKPEITMKWAETISHKNAKFDWLDLTDLTFSDVEPSPSEIAPKMSLRESWTVTNYIQYYKVLKYYIPNVALTAFCGNEDLQTIEIDVYAFTLENKVNNLICVGWIVFVSLTNRKTAHPQ